MGSRDAGIQIEGGRQLRTTLKKAGDDLNDLKAAHAEAANIVADEAKGTAPSVTGTLASTIRGTGTKTAAIARAGKASVPYANVIHWGWPAHNIAANPFLTTSADTTKPRWLDIYTTAVEKALSKIEGLT